MRVVVVGCSGSYPGPNSPASCYLVQAEHEGRTWNIVIDLGNGSMGALQRYVEPTDLDAVIVSHLHPDHCLDLCSLYVVLSHHPRLRRAQPLPVYGPRGTAQRIGRAHGVEGAEDLSDRYEFIQINDGSRFVIGPFSIVVALVNHPVEAYGVRVECQGATLAYTGDTDSCAALDGLLHGADLVLADCAFPDEADTPPGVHMSGRRAALAAVSAGGVGTLVLTHIPAWNDAEQTRAEAARVWPAAQVCQAGDVFTV